MSHDIPFTLPEAHGAAKKAAIEGLKGLYPKACQILSTEVQRLNAELLKKQIELERMTSALHKSKGVTELALNPVVEKIDHDQAIMIDGKLQKVIIEPYAEDLFNSKYVVKCESKFLNRNLTFESSLILLNENKRFLDEFLFDNEDAARQAIVNYQLTNQSQVDYELIGSDGYGTPTESLATVTEDELNELII